MTDPGGPFKIEVTTWVNGAPTVVKTVEPFKSRSDGMERLRDIGHSWEYDIDYCAHLIDASGKKIGQLDIFNYTYRVTDLEAPPPTPKTAAEAIVNVLSKRPRRIEDDGVR